jgi:hypothetical protein
MRIAVPSLVLFVVFLSAGCSQPPPPAPASSSEVVLDVPGMT